MTKEWCDAFNKEAQEKIDKALKVFDDFIDLKREEYDTNDFCFKNYIKYGEVYGSRDIFQYTKPYINKRPIDDEDVAEVVKRFNLQDAIDVLCHYTSYWNPREPYNYYDVYKDGKWVDFDGDILITDPCYFFDALKGDFIEYQETKPSVSILKYNELRDKAFSKSIVSRTLAGDWGCQVYLSNNKKQIGTFGADGGMVSVTYLSETDNYNPEWRHLSEDAYTIIPNFKGKVRFVITGDLKEKKDSFGYTDKYLDAHVSIIGRGINSKTGERLDFFTEGY